VHLGWGNCKERVYLGGNEGFTCVTSFEYVFCTICGVRKEFYPKRFLRLWEFDEACATLRHSHESLGDRSGNVGSWEK
jgi:hypothetical protein